MALGASHRQVLAMVLAQGAWMVGIGLALGVGAAILFGHSIADYLYQTPVVNPFVYLAVGALFVLAGFIACLGPARRATSIDPLIALRAE
jgi:ABC-type antimicrobial peptide transport system permease subunit